MLSPSSLGSGALILPSGTTAGPFSTASSTPGARQSCGLECAAASSLKRPSILTSPPSRAKRCRTASPASQSTSSSEASHARLSLYHTHCSGIRVVVIHVDGSDAFNLKRKLCCRSGPQHCGRSPRHGRQAIQPFLAHHAHCHRRAAGQAGVDLPRERARYPRPGPQTSCHRSFPCRV